MWIKSFLMYFTVTLKEIPSHPVFTEEEEKECISTFHYDTTLTNFTSFS